MEKLEAGPPHAEQVRIISPYAGGLGDQLCFSTLPEMYARQGYTVLIGAPAVEPAIRNPETQQLVWEHNPFVSGFTTERGRTFSHKEMHKWIWAQSGTRTLVEAMEALHGFAPTHRYPRVYYQPKWRPEFRATVFADPTSVSQSMRPEVFEAFVDHLCRARDFEKESIVVLTSQHAGPHGQGALSKNRRYSTANIYEYADIIYSCHAFIASESGGAILASAIRQFGSIPEVFSLFTNYGVNDRLFQFPNVRYCATGQMGDDYYLHPPSPSR
jgi:hypothetical protein